MADEELIMAFFKAIQVRKKQNLIEAGQTCTSLFFVVQGCLRLFYLSEKGVEQTIQFAIENWWLTDFSTYPQQNSTEFTALSLIRFGQVQLPAFC